MHDHIYGERLAWFKRNEKPEVVLLIADNPELTSIVVAWTNLEVKRVEKLTEPGRESESGLWRWLWENADYSRATLIEKIGVSYSELGLEGKMKLLIGNRILYPDGTVNSFVQRYLRDRVLKLFESKSQRQVKKA